MFELYGFAHYTYVEPFKAKLYLILLEIAVNKAIIQCERIAHDKSSLRKLVDKLADSSLEMKQFILPSLPEVDLPYLRRKQIMDTLFSDIHHYLICWAEVSKIYDRLLKVQAIFKAVPKGFLKDLKEHRDFRNHLEHVDDRVERGVTDLGNLSDDKFSFDGKKLDVSIRDLEKLRVFYERLIEIAYENFEQFFPMKTSPGRSKP